MRGSILALFLLGGIGCSTLHIKKPVSCDSAALLKFQDADQIILYSLYPSEVRNLVMDKRPESERLIGLPEFHEFPVFGTVRLSDSAQVTSWATTLQTALVDRPESVCDFMPRHGVRIIHQGLVTDFLMCFTCGDMVVWTEQSRAEMHHPVWTKKVRNRMNALFDQHQIERDIP
ncbi:MAG: hypothetical protein KDK99_08330 [Verrucomicrobiales bacterium]|nr:hypothetical protein [Verrucomicrobiales bacterium]